MPETRAGANYSISSIVRTYRRGPASLFNLSAYSFGLSAMATGIGSGILPFKVLDVLDAGTVIVFGNELDKNGTLGLISLIGLACAAVMQPASGVMSDRSLKSTGKRLPFIAVGAVLMAVSAYFFGAANTFLSVLLGHHPDSTIREPQPGSGQRTACGPHRKAAIWGAQPAH